MSSFVSCWQCSQSGLNTMMMVDFFFDRSSFVKARLSATFVILKGGTKGNRRYNKEVSAWASPVLHEQITRNAKNSFFNF